MIRNYTSKPVHIEAMLYNGETAGVLPEWLRKAVVNSLDYIIRYEDGSIDVMRKDAFEATFEEDKEWNHT